MYKIIGADQKEYGPVSADEIRRWVAEGRANAQTLLQAEGQTDWRPLATFAEFASGPTAAPGGQVFSGGPDVDAARLISGPATGLLVVGILCAVTAVLSLLSHLLGAGARNTQDIPPQLRQIVEMTTGSLGLVVNFLGLGISALIIFASTKMRKLESRGLVLTATILSMLPCTSACCCVGLPVGVWILIVLNKPGVKSAFR